MRGFPNHEKPSPGQLSKQSILANAPAINASGRFGYRQKRLGMKLAHQAASNQAIHPSAQLNLHYQLGK